MIGERRNSWFYLLGLVSKIMLCFELVSHVQCHYYRYQHTKQPSPYLQTVTTTLKPAFLASTCKSTMWNSVSSRAYLAELVFEGVLLSYSTKADMGFYSVTSWIKAKGSYQPKFLAIDYRISPSTSHTICNHQQIPIENHSYFVFAIPIKLAGLAGMDSLVARSLAGPPVKTVDVPNPEKDIWGVVCEDCAQPATVTSLDVNNRIISQSTPFLIRPGRNLRLRCYTRGNPEAEVTWYRVIQKEGKKRKHRVVIGRDAAKWAVVKQKGNHSVLRLYHASVSDSGHYECSAKNVVSNAKKYSKASTLGVEVIVVDKKKRIRKSKTRKRSNKSWRSIIWNKIAPNNVRKKEEGGKLIVEIRPYFLHLQDLLPNNIHLEDISEHNLSCSVRIKGNSSLKSTLTFKWYKDGREMKGNQSGAVRFWEAPKTTSYLEFTPTVHGKDVSGLYRCGVSIQDREEVKSKYATVTMEKRKKKEKEISSNFISTPCSWPQGQFCLHGECYIGNTILGQKEVFCRCHPGYQGRRCESKTVSHRYSKQALDVYAEICRVKPCH